MNSMQDAHHEDEVAETDAYRDEVLARLEVIEGMLEKKRQNGRQDALSGRDETASRRI